MRAGISPGARKQLLSTSREAEPDFAFAASSVSWSYERSIPCFCQCFLHSCRSQRPIIFLRRRILPLTPPSLVKGQANVLSFMTAVGDSTPISDQVPLDKYAHLVLPSAGTAATALAVSCEATAITGIGEQPISLATLFVSAPIAVPGLTISGIISRGRFNLRKIADDHLPERISISWLVLARVYSAYGFPERKYETRSAIKMRRFAFASAGEPDNRIVRSW